MKKNNKENFSDLEVINKNNNEKNNNNIKEPFDRRCTSIYGNYHPKCQSSSRLKHVGYFKFNTIKYPLLILILDLIKICYVKK